MLKLQNSNVIVQHYFKYRRNNESMSDFYKAVPGFEKYYLVSRIGKIFARNRRGYNRWFQLIPYHSRGYEEVTLWNNSSRQCSKYIMHRLVALLFIPKPQDKPLVCHKNDIRDDNRIENLYWGDAVDNYLDAVRNGRH